MRLYLTKGKVPDDLTGRTYNEWTVLSKVDARRWLCLCSCGVERPVDAANLKNGKSPSCGHLRREKWLKRCEAQRNEILGEQFGFLTVIATGQDYGKDAFAICLCACGQTKQSRISTLLNGMTKSCGCLNSSTSSHRIAAKNATHEQVYQDGVAIGYRLGTTGKVRLYAIKTCTRCHVAKPSSQFGYYETIRSGKKGKPYCLTCE